MQFTLAFFFLSFCVFKGDPLTFVRVHGSVWKKDDFDIAIGVNYDVASFFLFGLSLSVIPKGQTI